MKKYCIIIFLVKNRLSRVLWAPRKRNMIHIGLSNKGFHWFTAQEVAWSVGIHVQFHQGTSLGSSQSGFFPFVFRWLQQQPGSPAFQYIQSSILIVRGFTSCRWTQPKLPVPWGCPSSCLSAFKDGILDTKTLFIGLCCSRQTHASAHPLPVLCSSHTPCPPAPFTQVLLCPKFPRASTHHCKQHKTNTANNPSTKLIWML